MHIKLFHPYYQDSLFCKEQLNLRKNQAYGYCIHQDINFEWRKEKTILQKNTQIVFIMPLWWYSLPWNFIKWCELINNHNYKLTNKKITFVILAGGNKHHYQGQNQVHLLNKWVKKALGNNNIKWIIHYGCRPENIDAIRSVWFKEWNFKKLPNNEETKKTIANLKQKFKEEKTKYLNLLNNFKEKTKILEKKYWFGKTNSYFNNQYQLFNNQSNFDIEKMQNEIINLSQLEVAFVWNEKVSFIPFQFKKWIDQVITYNVYNENLEVTIVIFTTNKDCQNHLITLIKTFNFIKAKIKQKIYLLNTSLSPKIILKKI